MGMTRQRREILNVLVQKPDHPTAETVFERVRSRVPDISLGTVYRNLNLLAEDGQLRKVHVPDGAARFDATLEKHEHLVCVKCGTVEDVVAEGYTLPDVFYKTGARILGYELAVQCVCANCIHGTK